MFRVVDDIYGYPQRSTGLGHFPVDGFVVGRGECEVGILEVTRHVGTRQVFDASLVAKLRQAAAQGRSDHLHPASGTQQQRDLTRRDLAAADHDAQLVADREEDWQVFHRSIRTVAVYVVRSRSD